MGCVYSHMFMVFINVPVFFKPTGYYNCTQSISYTGLFVPYLIDSTCWRAHDSVYNHYFFVNIRCAQLLYFVHTII